MTCFDQWNEKDKQSDNNYTAGQQSGKRVTFTANLPSENDSRRFPLLSNQNKARALTSQPQVVTWTWRHKDTLRCLATSLTDTAGSSNFRRPSIKCTQFSDNYSEKIINTVTPQIINVKKKSITVYGPLCQSTTIYLKLVLISVGNLKNDFTVVGVFDRNYSVSSKS